MNPDVKCLVFKVLGSGKYLRYVREPPEINPFPTRKLFKDIIHASGDDPASPRARFYAEPSQEYTGLYHLRCSYNDKYMVAKEVEGRLYLFCDATEPQDDPNQSSCTLLRLPPLMHDSEMQIPDRRWFFVIPHGHPTISNLRGCLSEAFVEDYILNGKMHTIEVVNPLVLPKQVCFKGDNGKYLTFFDENLWEKLRTETLYEIFNEKPILASFSASDIGDPSVLVGVIQTMEDGRIGFQNGRTGRYLWRHDQGEPLKFDQNNLILPESKTIKNDDPNFWFRVIKLGNKKIALQHIKSGRFCRRLNLWGWPGDLFAADNETISESAQLDLEEPVRSRQIYNVKYDTANAKIYNQKVVTLTTVHAVNRGSVENTAKMSLKFSITKQTSWNVSNTVTTGINFSITAGIPKIKAEVGFEYHRETTDTRSWGESKTETEEESIDYELKTPPKTKVTLKLMATEATCQIPFSYSQKDVLTDGSTVEYHQLENGVYRGVNNYDLSYEVTEESLEHNDKAATTSHSDKATTSSP